VLLAAERSPVHENIWHKPGREAVEGVGLEPTSRIHDLRFDARMKAVKRQLFTEIATNFDWNQSVRGLLNSHGCEISDELLNKPYVRCTLTKNLNLREDLSIKYMVPVITGPTGLSQYQKQEKSS